VEILTPQGFAQIARCKNFCDQHKKLNKDGVSKSFSMHVANCNTIANIGVLKRVTNVKICRQKYFKKFLKNAAFRPDEHLECAKKFAQVSTTSIPPG
jgi:hypothetical protein